MIIGGVVVQMVKVGEEFGDDRIAERGATVGGEVMLWRNRMGEGVETMLWRGG